MYKTTRFDGMSADEKARRAIFYALTRIRDDARISYFCGLGTEMFAQLTEAYAGIIEQPVDEVRRAFDCQDTRKPRWPENRDD